LSGALKTSVAEPRFFLPELDGIRAIAIGMVVLFHSSLDPLAPSYFFAEFPFYIEKLSRGVQLFFIVSAYTLFRSANVRNERGIRFFPRFYVRRAFRILPLWWAVCAIYYFWAGRSISQTFYSVTFLFGFLQDSYEVCSSPVGWSLFVEETFYLFFPVWISLIRSPLRALMAFIASVGLCYFAVANAGRFEFSKGTNFYGTFPIFNYYAFFLGILIWFLLHDSRCVRLQRLFHSKRSRWPIELAALIAFLTLFFVERPAGTVCMGFVFLSSLHPSTLVGRLCRSRLFGVIGGSCYGIYLLHSFLNWKLWGLRPYVSRLSLQTVELESLLWFVVVMIVSTVVAQLSLRFFELPFVRIGRRLAEKLGPAV
jgi:peptidoglycan/LPS O-acetylase OafA/YrhL